MPVLHLDRLRAPELAALSREKTVFFLPIGPIEDHGDALPISLDLDEARSVCLRTAETLSADGWNAILAPSAALGVDSNTSALAIRVRPHVLRDYLVDFCDSLAKSGFRYFIAVSGHPGPRQLTTIEDAGKFLRKRHLRFGIFPNAKAPILVSGASIAIDKEELSDSMLFPFPPEHGGKRDASVALALRDVDPAYSVDESLVKASASTERETSLFPHWLAWRKGNVRGHWGATSTPSAHIGNERIQEKSKTIATKFRAAVEGGRAHHLFKSWYSVIPMNQSLFRIWILVFLLTVLLGGWVFYSVQGFLAGADLSP
jgi:creatinine amidohydrolase/Fe(II)-dependent formamide hydrolase-like protein